MIELTPLEIESVRAFMHDECGNDLSQREYLVSSLVGILCDRLGYRRFRDFWVDASEDTIAGAELRQQVIDTLTTSYSYFHRESRHFALLKELVRNGAIGTGPKPLRIWSAGCATGEEPYNIAMVLEDMRREGRLSSGYRIVASDISTKALAVAKAGHYSTADVARLPLAWRDRYCLRTHDGCEMRAELRRGIAFRHENILNPRPGGTFDIIWCRNVIIYFDQTVIDSLLKEFKRLTRLGGYLFLGHAEIATSIEGFSYVQPSVWLRD
ncbi:MAG: protein-glutamate O-methyltransferase CheR [Coriobacteriales bacterium]|nr:protein-glutamate O-methyltransferase CheR [Coriobacteriales bacterium]